MEVRTTLMGAFKPLAPPDNRLTLEDGASINDALAALNINPQRVQIVMRNDRPAADRSRRLEDGDRITVIPMVGGG